MADADDKKAQDNAQDKAQDNAKTEDNKESKQAAPKIGIVTWAILAVIVVLCAGSGLLLGRLFGGSDKPQTQSSQTDESTSVETPETENLEFPQR